MLRQELGIQKSNSVLDYASIGAHLVLFSSRLLQHDLSERQLSAFLIPESRFELN